MTLGKQQLDRAIGRSRRNRAFIAARQTPADLRDARFALAHVSGCRSVATRCVVLPAADEEPRSERLRTLFLSPAAGCLELMVGTGEASVLWPRPLRWASIGG